MKRGRPTTASARPNPERAIDKGGKEADYLFYGPRTCAFFPRNKLGWYLGASKHVSGPMGNEFSNEPFPADIHLGRPHATVDARAHTQRAALLSLRERRERGKRAFLRQRSAV